MNLKQSNRIHYRVDVLVRNSLSCLFFSLRMQIKFHVFVLQNFISKFIILFNPKIMCENFFFVASLTRVLI